MSKKDFEREYGNFRAKLSTLILAMRLLKEEFEKLPPDLQALAVKSAEEII